MSCRFLIILAVILCAAEFSRAATNDFFAQGIGFSQAGQFPEASAAFEKAAQAQPASGTLVNLGIADWRRGRAGPAILAWEQAQWIDPFDSRARANLKFARSAAQVDAPQLKWFETASSWLPPDAWVWLAGVSLWLAVGLLTLPEILRRRKAGWQQALAALAFGFFLFSITANLGVVSRTQIGFVLKKNAPLLLTPTREAEVVSTLNAGMPARRLRTRGNYFFIRTAFATGWISREQFGLICPDQPDAGGPPNGSSQTRMKSRPGNNLFGQFIFRAVPVIFFRSEPDSCFICGRLKSPNRKSPAAP